MYTLIGLHFSPWTERARWALDYHEVPYRYLEYTPMLGELTLRLRTGTPFRKVTVPVLTTPQRQVNDSFQIARLADETSSKTPLIPAARFDEVRKWVDLTERALWSARIRATRRIMKSSEALADRLPDYVPRYLRKAFVPMAYLGSGLILMKYRLEDDDDDTLLRSLDVFLDGATAALKDRAFIFGEFGFADIVLATMLQAVTPVSRRYIKLNEASAKCMREPELAAKYAALVHWRDRLYEDFR